MTFDNSSVFNGSSLFGQSSWNGSYTTGSLSNGVLLIWVFNTSGSGGAGVVTGVDYNGVAMTLVATYSAGNMALYYLANPASGTNTVKVHTNAIYANVVVYAASYGGASQSTPTVTSNNTSTGTSLVS